MKGIHKVGEVFFFHFGAQKPKLRNFILAVGLQREYEWIGYCEYGLCINLWFVYLTCGFKKKIKQEGAADGK